VVDRKVISGVGDITGLVLDFAATRWWNIPPGGGAPVSLVSSSGTGYIEVTSWDTYA
jgi:hypothetical protein